MGYNVVGAALKHYPHGGNKKLVLLAIAENANIETWVCWPSIDTIARCSCQSTRSVTRLVKQLEDEGILEVRRFPGKRKNNVYRVRVDRLEAMPTLLRTPFNEMADDLFDPVDDGEKPVDNPVETKRGCPPSRKPDCPPMQDTAVSHEPLVTINKTINKSGGKVENLIGELSDRLAMPND